MNLTDRVKAKYVYAFILCCVFMIMFVLSSLTPLLADDYSYSFSYADRSKRISNLRDVFESMAAHRYAMNGRVVSHSLAHIFLMLPKPVFNVFNALNATLLIMFMHKYYCGRSSRNNILLTMLSVAMIWHFMPNFGQVFLWLDGSLNYSWCATVILAFLYPFFSEYFRKEPIFSGKLEKAEITAFILFSFVAGAYSESASCAALLIAVCFVLLCWMRDRHISKLLLAALISAVLGFAFMMLSPSELSGRTSQFSIGVIAHNIQRVVSAPQQYLLVLYCAFAALFTVCIVAKMDKTVLITAAIFLLGNIASIVVFTFAVYFPARSLCVPTIFLITPCLMMLDALTEKGFRYLLAPLTAVSFTVCVFSFVLGVGDIAVVYYESKQREAAIYQAIEAGEDFVQIYQYSGNTKYNGAYSLPDAYEDCGVWPNYDMAQYYGIGAISGVPMTTDYFGE